MDDKKDPMGQLGRLSDEPRQHQGIGPFEVSTHRQDQIAAIASRLFVALKWPKKATFENVGIDDLMVFAARIYDAAGELDDG